MRVAITIFGVLCVLGTCLESVAEDSLEEAIAAVRFGETIAVSQMKPLTAVFEIHCVAMNRNPEMFFEKVIHPEIMVAADIIDFDSSVSQVAKHEQHFVMRFGDDILVFKPKVE